MAQIRLFSHDNGLNNNSDTVSVRVSCAYVCVCVVPGPYENAVIFSNRIRG